MAVQTEKDRHLGEPREKTARLTLQDQYVAASWTPGSMKSTTAFRLSVAAVVGLKIPHVTWSGLAYVTKLNALWNTSILNGSSCFWLQQVALLWWVIFWTCPRNYHSYTNIKITLYNKPSNQPQTRNQIGQAGMCRLFNNYALIRTRERLIIFF